MKKTLLAMWDLLRGLHPVKLLLLGYASYVVGGWVLLCVPWAQSGQGVGALDNLLISSSAVSTTGLVTASVSGDYSWFGQAVILMLIQVGGLGYMTFSSFVILCRKQPLSETRTGVSHAVFSLPKSFRLDKFIRSVMAFTVAVEAGGAAALYAIFRQAGEAQPLWSAVFHSVSAFCTAGFSLYDDSLVRFADNFWLNVVVAALSYTGAIGFIVCVDVWRRVTGKIRHITLTSKIILHVTLWMALSGTLLFFFTEPSIRSLRPDVRLMASFFQAMSAMTTVGFNTIPIGPICRAGLLLLTVLMVIGASPSGTGGGLKSTTFSAIVGIARSVLRGETTVRFWGHRVPEERLWTAVASLGFYLAFLVVGTYFLELTEQMPFEALMFEAASALGTVGLSTGVTAQLSHLGKLIVTALMFVGRVGPLTFGTALFLSRGVLAPDRDTDVAV
ncbi:MAG TPA: potassium transporter TrkG [Phycisphaerae bacterium]|nr:potassium transporter TrkG [Phycisphaerae bacterium]